MDLFAHCDEKIENNGRSLAILDETEEGREWAQIGFGFHFVLAVKSEEAL